MGLKGDDILIVSGSYSNAPYEPAPEILVHFILERAVKAQGRLCIILCVLEQDTLSSAYCFNQGKVWKLLKNC